MDYSEWPCKGRGDEEKRIDHTGVGLACQVCLGVVKVMMEA